MTNGTVPVGSAPDAAQRVKIPAVALMVVGGISVVGYLVFLVSSILDIVRTMEAGQQFSEKGLEPAGLDHPLSTDLAAGGVAIVVSLVAIVICGIVVLGALKMKRLESYRLARTAAIIGCIPGCSGCFPIGIWALVVLLKPEIKAAFK